MPLTNEESDGELDEELAAAAPRAPEGFAARVMARVEGGGVVAIAPGGSRRSRRALGALVATGLTMLAAASLLVVVHGRRSTPVEKMSAGKIGPRPAPKPAVVAPPSTDIDLAAATAAVKAHLPEIIRCFDDNSAAAEVDNHIVLKLLLVGVRGSGHISGFSIEPPSHKPLGEKTFACLSEVLTRHVEFPSPPVGVSELLFTVARAPADVRGTDADAPAAEVMVAAVRREMPAVRKCYEAAIARNPALRGRYTARIDLTVRDGRGSVKRATLDPVPRDAKLASCIVGVFTSRLHFAWPEDGESQFEFPLILKEDDAEEKLAKSYDEYVHGNYATALDLATSANTDSANPKAWKIIGGVSCYMKNRDAAIEAWFALDNQGRQFLNYVCGRNALVIPTGAPIAARIVSSAGAGKDVTLQLDKGALDGVRSGYVGVVLQGESGRAPIAHSSFAIVNVLDHSATARIRRLDLESLGSNARVLIAFGK